MSNCSIIQSQISDWWETRDCLLLHVCIGTWVYWHVWAHWAKPCCTDSSFYYQFNCAALQLRWIIEVGKKKKASREGEWVVTHKTFTQKNDFHVILGPWICSHFHKWTRLGINFTNCQRCFVTNLYQSEVDLVCGEGLAHRPETPKGTLWVREALMHQLAMPKGTTVGWE